MNVVLCYRDLRALLPQIKCGDGVALVAGHHGMCSDSDVRLIPISDCEACFLLSTMWHKGVGPACQKLLKDMCDEFVMKGKKSIKVIRECLKG